MTEGIAAVPTAPATERSTTARLAWLLAPFGVALGSLALGAVALGHRSLSAGEATSITQAQGSLGTLLSRILHDAPDQAGGLLALALAGTGGTTS